MSKDDYHVLAYQLLSYLYDCLRRGEVPDEEQVYWNEAHAAVKVNERYWNYVLRHLSDEGYIEGLSFLSILGRKDLQPRIDGVVAITPKGIDFLDENSRMKKAYRFIKGVKEIIPGV
nr:YjcQ family protein [uncultured Selenomonas sp.]